MMLSFWHIWSQSSAIASSEQKQFQPDAALYEELYHTPAALFGFSWRDNIPLKYPGKEGMSMDKNSRVHTVFWPFSLVFQWLLDSIEPGWHSIWSGKRDLNPQPSAWEALEFMYNYIK